MPREKRYYLYIMTNKYNTTLYTGVTGNLEGRVLQHKQKQIEDFTKRYNINKLVYFEEFQYIEDAIAREKQIKAGSSKKKVELIKSMDPKWQDLSEDWYKKDE
jgi:putative endonuclease